MSSEDSSEIATESATSILEDPNLVALPKFNKKTPIKIFQNSKVASSRRSEYSGFLLTLAKIVEEIEQSVTEAIDSSKFSQRICRNWAYVYPGH